MKQRKYNRIDFRITDYHQWKETAPFDHIFKHKRILKINKQPKADESYLTCRYTIRVNCDNLIFFHFYEIYKTILIHIDVRFVTRFLTMYW